MRKLLASCVLTIFALAAALPSPATAEPGLVMLGKEPAEHAVTLARTADGTLRGALAIPVQSKVKAESIRATYLPTGNVGNRGAVEVALQQGSAAKIGNNGRRSIRLIFEIPGGSSPLSLNGFVFLKPVVVKASDKTKEDPLSLRVVGAGPALVGVSVKPEKLDIEVVDPVNPFGSPDHASAQVQLTGPGVPFMFGGGQEPPSFSLRLQSDRGRRVTATLDDLEQDKANPDLATGTVEIDGNLAVGKYEGSTPISSLSAAAPELTISIESGDSMIPAVVAVFVGTLFGGALYLASSRRRRKDLLRDRIKSLLGKYEQVRAELSEHSPNGAAVWSLDRYLGPRSAWYQIKWNAIPAFDGVVQTAWSEIHWARDEADLDEASKRVDEMRGRLLRWLKIAEGIIDLERAAALKPAERASQPWDEGTTATDTEFLLGLTRRIEPPDDKATDALVDRIERQARWQTLLARARHAFVVLDDHMSSPLTEDLYGKNDRRAIAAIDLTAIEAAGSPEPKRDGIAQIKLEQQLGDVMETIQDTYAGNGKDLELAESRGIASRTIQPGAALALHADGHPTGAVDRRLQDAEAIDVERAPKPEMVIDRIRGASSATHTGERLPPAIGAIARRDLLWSMATALAASIVYVPTFYNSTWGTPEDYASAFAAGFVGKVAVNWAAMPLFQSLNASRASKPPAPPEKPAASGEPEKPAEKPPKAPTEPTADGDNPAVAV
jgi:hypothetical protein